MYKVRLPEDDFSTHYDNLPVAAAIITPYPEFNIVHINRQMALMLGYATLEEFQEHIGDNTLALIHPRDVERVLELATNRTPTTGVSEIVYRLMEKGGGYRWVKQQSAPIVGGRFDGHILMTYMDITDDIKMPKTLEEFVVNLPGGVFHYPDDDEMLMDYVSPHFYELLGYTEEEFDRKFHHSFKEMVYEEDRSRVLAEIDEQMKTSDYDACEYRIEKKDGSLIWVSDVGHRVMDPNGKLYFYVLVIDITKSQLLQQALDGANAANRAKSDFLSRMSHDIRTPMNAIIGLVSLALEEPGLTPILERYLKQIDSSSHFLLSLINDILDVSKIEDGSLKLCPHRYEYHEFHELMTTMAVPLCEEHDVSFTFVPSNARQPILVDKVRLNQVFINLISNAAKYTPPGGSVEFAMHDHGVRDGFLDCDFVVRDTGIGMSREFMKHMFEPFVQEDDSDAKAEFKGTGLGLTIVKSLVDLMGGTINIESTVNKGTTVTVSLALPLDTSRNEQTGEKTTSPTNDAQLNGKTILLVEDQPLNSEIAKRLLEKVGMKVLIAGNGKQGVETFEKSIYGSIDAILMDVRMPVMNGFEATETLRALNRPDAKSVPIIAMTANAFDEDVQHSLECGMSAHLSKPVDPKLLYSTLSEQLGSRP